MKWNKYEMIIRHKLNLFKPEKTPQSSYHWIYSQLSQLQMSTAGWAPVTISDIKIICGQNQFRSYDVSRLLISGDNVTISELEIL